MTDPKQAPAQKSADDDDPNVIGRLNDEEMSQWAQARQMGNQTVLELGNMVLRAVRMVGQVDRAEAQIRQMLQGAAKRMGLADDVKFQALPDGRIRVIADIQPVAPQTQQPAVEEPAKTEEAAAAAEEPKAEVPAKAEADDEPDPMEAVAKAKAAVEAEKAKEAESPPPA